MGDSKMIGKRLLGGLSTAALAIWLTPIANAAVPDSVVEAAKKEGEIVFYGTMELTTSQKLAALFNKKYPFIKTNIIRLGSERLAERVTVEAQAKTVKADVIHESEMDFYGLLKKGFTESY